MDMLTRPAKIWIAITTLSALSLAGYFTIASGLPALEISRVGFIAGITLLAYRFHVSFGFKRRIYLDVVAITCAALVLDPGQAALAIGVGAMAGQLLRSPVWDEATFNASQAMLQVLAGGFLLGAINWDLDRLSSDPGATIAGLVLFLVAIYAVNSVMVASIIGFQSGIPTHKVLVESGTSIIEFLCQATQVSAGLFTALLVTSSLWLGALALVPCGALYVILRRNVQNQKHTIVGMLDTLADLVDFRDPYTATHARQVASIARLIAVEMGLPHEQVDLIAVAARHHNLGSLTIGDMVQDTPGSLHSDAWNTMRQVPSMSAALLYQFPDTTLAGTLVKHHLERYDGEGYPDGLAGDDIPLGSRIIAVADSIDAMMRHRPYRPALSQSEIRSELERFRGTQWDPNIVDIALTLIDRGVISLSRQADIGDEKLSSRGAGSTRTIEQQIQHQAFHDPLTDLPNRLLLMTRLSRSLTGGGAGFAVLFIDLDGFKEVNDLLGHRAGDQVLIHASERMRNELRTDDFLARLGGDEFVAILWDVSTAAEGEDAAQRIIGSLGQPYSDLPHSISLAASIGIAIAMPGADTPDGVLHRADGAMYEAKRNGKGRMSMASADEARRELIDLMAG